MRIFVVISIVILAFRGLASSDNLQATWHRGYIAQDRYQPHLFEITRIDSVNNVYFIYASRNDSIVKIVSSKEYGLKCECIVLKGKYDLKIKSLLNGLSGKRHVGGVMFEKTMIPLEGDGVVWDLFICENMRGLCEPMVEQWK
jgi:hypothetical protein